MPHNPTNVVYVYITRQSNNIQNVIMCLPCLAWFLAFGSRLCVVECFIGLINCTVIWVEVHSIEQTVLIHHTTDQLMLL